MASPQRPTPDLATMLPGPRFQPSEQLMPVSAQGLQRAPSSSPPSLHLDEQTVAEQRGARMERRRMKQASPLEGRNVRHSGTGEPDGGLTTPTRSRPQSQSEIQPQGTPPPIRTASPEINADMARYGLVADTAVDTTSPTHRPSRQQLSNPGRQSPEQRSAVTPTASDQGSEVESPSRRISRTDLYSSRESLESLPSTSRANRKGSGFRRADKSISGAAAAAKAAAAKAGAGEMHVVGEIVGASGFSFPMLFCRWELVYDPAKSWKVLRGLTKGSTHACCRGWEEEELVVWEHPLDILLQTQSLQGWPSLLLRVHARDESNNRDSFVSYGLVKLPTTPGLHHLSCRTWFAVETNRAAGRTFFGWHTGLIPRLEDESFVTDLRQRDDAGPFICTVGTGEVHLRLSILTKNFSHISHQGGESLVAALERLNINIQKSVMMEERRRSLTELLTEGQKLVRGGREERMASARSALDSRRRGGDQLRSPAPSETSRSPSFLERQSRSSFRGFGGMRASASPGRLGSEPAGTQELDGRSETSAGSFSRPRDRYAERMARRERERTAREGGSATPSVLGGEASGGTGVAPSSDSGGVAAPSRPVSMSGAPASRTNSGIAERGGRGGGGGTATATAAVVAGRQTDGDDGIETVTAEEDVGGGGGGGGGIATAIGSDDLAAARAAARMARRAQPRSAF
ncbi:hypothetical protein Vretimale_18228 [Volvox reticuliferus]|uniref:B9 domain-containing protein 2 n=1 Tax=Volvox reticuliferus TaxID=1737510 RepID=A0A8J4GWR2_9CHLO|nr:hypothetical protein Vretifemale_17997 [Volvox reticuliferus]GIM15447.1 hypothetical protein Vretimale_18228 [Volvox reticuliferus]